MKKLVVLCAIAIVGLVAFNYATTGELTLVPSVSKSDEERTLKVLQDDFTAARSQFNQAHRTASVSGLDTTGDADAAIGDVKRIKRELDSLLKKLSEDRSKRKAEDLARSLREFEKQLG